MPRDRHDEVLQPEEMLGSLFRVYQRCVLAAGGQPAAEWGDLDDDEHAAWAAAYSELLRLTTETEGDPPTYDAVAANVNLRFQETVYAGGLAGQVVRWEEIATPVRLLWQGLVRHMVNLLSIDVEEDGKSTETHEERIGLWYVSKLKALNLPEQDQRALAEFLDAADAKRTGEDRAAAAQ